MIIYSHSNALAHFCPDLGCFLGCSSLLASDRFLHLFDAMIGKGRLARLNFAPLSPRARIFHYS